jgi:hypothetical protein
MVILKKLSPTPIVLSVVHFSSFKQEKKWYSISKMSSCPAKSIYQVSGLNLLLKKMLYGAGVSINGSALASKLSIDAARWDHALFMQEYPNNCEK